MFFMRRILSSPSWLRKRALFQRSFVFFSQREYYKLCKKFTPLISLSPQFHCGRPNFVIKDLEPTKQELALRDRHFREIKIKDKATFLKIIEVYNAEDKVKRGHLEFIYAALKYMVDYGVEGNIDVYKKIFDIFPKGKMIPKNLIQAEFYHFAKHQECAVFALDQMEYNGICPDKELRDIILAAFGKSTHVYKKYARMLYWMPKLKNINPYLLPDPLPDDVRELARLALKKMSVDKATKIDEYEAEKLEDATDKTWIFSAQSHRQRQLIHDHPEEKALFVEGPTLVWLRKLSMSYFVLRADPNIYPVDEDDHDDVTKISLHMFGEKRHQSLVLAPQSVHEQEDGVILGMCCTGTSSKDSVLSWIRFLREENPKLDNIPILFKIRTSPTALVAVNVKKKKIDEAEDSDSVKEESAA